MKRIVFLMIALALVMSVIAVRPAQAHDGGRVSLDQVRDATEAIIGSALLKMPDTTWFLGWIIVSIIRAWVGWDTTISTSLCSIMSSNR
jgi:hypothetical protein